MKDWKLNKSKWKAIQRKENKKNQLQFIKRTRKEGSNERRKKDQVKEGNPRNKKDRRRQRDQEKYEAKSRLRVELALKSSGPCFKTSKGETASF